MYALKKKFTTEYTGMESYVDDEIKNESVAWIPIWRATAINDGQEMDMDEQEEGTIPTGVIDQLNSIAGCLKDIDDKLQVDNYT